MKGLDNLLREILGFFRDERRGGGSGCQDCLFIECLSAARTKDSKLERRGSFIPLD